LAVEKGELSETGEREEASLVKPRRTRKRTAGSVWVPWCPGQRKLLTWSRLLARSMGMTKKRVFISYDYTNDKNYKRLLLAWDKNEEFDFSFYDMSVEVPVDSADAAAIKSVISARIGDATHFLCLVGKYTYKTRWVDWEIKKAAELKKKIVAVQAEKNTTTPNALYGVGASWALSFDFDVIKESLSM
jgi:hypothetical protein